MYDFDVRREFGLISVFIKKRMAMTVSLAPKRHFLRVVLGGVLLFVAVGCGESTTGIEELTNDDFAPSLNVDLNAMTRTVSGLYWQDLVVGTGEEAVVGDVVRMKYDGFLINGNLFDTSEGKPEPFEFLLGARQVIRGWDEGVPGMRVGGMRKLVIPSNLGYGPAGNPPAIPPNATLVFDVEILVLNP